MFIECRHILPSGLKCKAPALRNNPFCYFHGRLRRYAEDGLSNRKEPLILPSLEDASGIQIGVMEVLNALGSGRIDRLQARVYLYGFQIASRLALRATAHEDSAVVRSMTCDNYGEVLAEEATACEPPSDCLACPKRPTCKDFENYETEVEELEDQLAEQEDEEEEEEEPEEQEEEEKEEEEPEEGEKEIDDQAEDDEEDAILRILNAQAGAPSKPHPADAQSKTSLNAAWVGNLNPSQTHLPAVAQPSGAPR